MEANICSIPNEIIRLIFSMLDLRSLACCFKVSKKWRNILGANNSLWSRFLPISFDPSYGCLRAYDIIRILRLSEASRVRDIQSRILDLDSLRHCPFNPYLHTRSVSPTNVLRLVYCYVCFPRAFSLFSGSFSGHFRQPPVRAASLLRGQKAPAIAAI